MMKIWEVNFDRVSGLELFHLSMCDDSNLFRGVFLLMSSSFIHVMGEHTSHWLDLIWYKDQEGVEVWKVSKTSYWGGVT